MLNTTIITKAISEAKKSKYKMRVGCVVFNKGTIVVCGNNSVRAKTKVHKSFMKFPESVHAEVAALSKIDNSDGYDLLVVRIGKQGQLLLAKPCPTCRKYIRHKGIRRVYYSTPNGIDREI